SRPRWDAGDRVARTAGAGNNRLTMIKLTITNDQQRLQISHAHGPLELGRGVQREIERVVIEDRYVSRDQCVLEEMPNDQLRLENLGSAMRLADGTQIEKGSKQ